MVYEIETNVEMPVRGRRTKYPIEELGIGESFFIEGRTKNLIVSKRLKSRKFVQAVMPRNGEDSSIGLRIKRIA